MTGTTISSTTFNSLTADLATAMTDSLDRQGRGGMSGALKVDAGTVSAPGLSFVAETGSGLYRAGSHDVRLAVNGADVAAVTTSGVAVTGKVTTSDGSVSAPAHAFGSETNSGLYRAASHDVRAAVNGADVLKLTTSGANVTGTLASSGALTVTAGGATVTAGGLTVSAGGATVTGTTVIAGAASVTGNDLTIDSGKSFKYASTVTHKLHLAPTDFISHTNYVLPSSIVGYNNTSSAAECGARLSLPPGAIITAIDLAVNNTDSSARTWGVTVAKYTKSSTGYNSATYITTGSGSGATVSATGSTANWYSMGIVGGVASIDDASADGFNVITVNLPATASGNQSQFIGLRITYTITSEKPAV